MWTEVVAGGRCWLVSIALLASFPVVAEAQRKELSPSDPASTWRSGQLAYLQQKIDSGEVQGDLLRELKSQQRWLSAWKPGKLADKPVWSVAEDRQLTPEPTLDPTGRASALRAALLADDAQPTVEDTRQLKEELIAHPTDVGLRQLHLHWLDQYTFRKRYAMEIAGAARAVIELLEALEGDLTADQRTAKRYAHYREVRALVYRGLPAVTADNPLDDPAAHESRLLSAYHDFKQMVPEHRPEFILVDVRMLRRDGWYGRSLALLEEFGESIDRKWLLKKRRDLLRELGWEPPAREAAELYASEFPDAVEKERQAELDQD